MERKRTSAWICILFAIAILLAPGLAAAQAAFDRIVVFGTSLSDPGNAFALISTANTPPYEALDTFLVPDRPYARGGLHFSNGATWIEQFARPLGMAGDARPAFRGSSLKADNYAVGGARAYDDGNNVNLSLQVTAFFSAHGGAAPPDALYAIEVGSNDVRDAMALYAAGGDGSSIISGALTSLGGTIQTLYAAGARTFLVWNAPNIALTPAVHILDDLLPGAAQLAEAVTLAYNADLADLLSMLDGLPGIEIRRLNAYQILNNLVTDPQAYGLSTVDASCVTPDVPPFTCAKPDAYLFWDGLHPTKAVHGIIAEETALILAQ